MTIADDSDGSGWLTMDSVRRTLEDFERRFPRKTTAGKLVMRQSTADTLKRYCKVRERTSSDLSMPFEGVMCEIDDSVADREVRVLNLGGEVIQVITI